MYVIIIGLVVGVVMGLTGAGGALVSIPLFMHFMHIGLKEASVYSLLAIVISAVTNFISQKQKNFDYRLVLAIGLFSILGSWVTYPLKVMVSDVVIALLLSLIVVYSLYNVWVNKKEKSNTKTKKSKLYAVLVGMGLGALTTFTGLGGGVLLMPVFLKLYNYTQAQAVAASLLAMGFSALSSLLIQIYKGAEIKLGFEIVYLVLGVVVAAWGIKKIIITKLTPEKTDLIRKVAFTLVVLLAIAKFYI